MRDARHIALAIVLALMLVFAGGVAGWKVRGGKVQPPPADTVVIHTIDTITLTEKIHDTTTLTYYKTIQVPFTVVEVDTVVDSVRITLPYERHFASLDSVADVWYSGYDAKIDSARVYKYSTTNYIYVREKQRNNLVGASAGLHDAALFYMHDFGRFAVGASAGYTYKGQPTARAVVGWRF